MAGMEIIKAHGLTKRFGPVRAVDDLSFSVERGSVTGFLGPNGAGKTTTLRMLLGLVTPDAGTATIGGHAYADLPEPLHEVGAVLEASGFHPGRTARNHLRIQALAARADPSRVDDVLDLVQLTDAADRRVGGFSLGMRQRLGLATALLPDPEILILDEPANGLDPEGVRWLRGLLRGFATEGGTVLVSSHMLAETAQTVDSVVIIDHGRLVTQSPLASLTAHGDLEDAFLQLTGRSYVKEAWK
jgi:ABC-2 type transport system ATP-binding protein